jgi:NifU-like protein involved in Fe-S cluster formation
MEAAEAKRLVFDLQSYHHPVNAIVYSKYLGQDIEVALKMSADGQTVEDISYKKRGKIIKQDGAANGSQPIRSETN